LNDTDTTRDAGEDRFRMSPTVKPMKFTGEPARPEPPSADWAGSSTTFTMERLSESHHSLATMPVCPGRAPVRTVECPGHVSVPE